MSSHPANTRRHIRRAFQFVVALEVLIALASCAGPPEQTVRRDPIATPARAAPTASARPRATSISTAQPTSTATSTPTPTATSTPTPAPQPPTRFAVIGDYGLAGEPARDVAALVKGWNPDFIITTGDNNYPDGAAATIDRNIGQYYHDFIAPYQGVYGEGAADNRFFPALGNHDWQTAGAAPYIAYFGLPGNERYYAFSHGNVGLFALDSTPDEPDGVSEDSVQAAWLRQELGASTACWNLVYMHHPPFSSGLHGSNRWMQWPYRAWGADAVLAGHDHDYERIIRDGLPYFVNGLGGGSRYALGAPVAGSELRYNGDHGALLVEAAGGTLTFTFIAHAGQVVDTYRLSKPCRS